MTAARFIRERCGDDVSMTLIDHKPYLIFMPNILIEVTDEMMRCTDDPNVFAAGDCAALTVPKLGARGHQQADIVARQIARDVGRLRAEEADHRFQAEIICMGEMGHHRAFCIHTNAWCGGDISVFKMGYTYHATKIAFKEMYFHTGGKPASWGIPLAELIAERVV